MAVVSTTRNGILNAGELERYMFGGIFAVTRSRVELHNFDSTSYVGTYFGTFRTNIAGDIVGTVNGFAFSYKGSNLFLEIKGLNLDAKAVFALVGSQDIDGLMALMFSSNDTFNLRSYQATYGTHSASAYGGSDIVYGSSGDDLFLGGSGKDTLYGAIGHDTLDGESGADVLYGDSGNDLMSGKSGSDMIFGGWGNDSLDGGAQNDRLSASLGDDFLAGGTGTDKLTGGSGDDAFVFYAPTEGGDAITDFGNSSGNDDSFHISAAGFGGGLLAGQSPPDGFFQTGPSNSAGATEVRFIFRTSDTTLWFDSDGNGSSAPVLLADLQAGVALSASDIWLF